MSEIQTSTQNEFTAHPVYETRPYKYLTMGMLLIAIGGMWLLWNLRLINWHWIERYGFVMIGAGLLIQTIVRKKNNIFWGVFLLLIGGFHLYLDYSTTLSMNKLWPVYFLSAGLALIVNYGLHIRRWMSLVMGILLAGFGVVQLARELMLIPYDFIFLAKVYWPLTFVLAGIIILCVTLIKHRNR